LTTHLIHTKSFIFSNMSSPTLCKCCSNNSNKKKGKTTYTFDLPLHQALVRTYVGKTQLTVMAGKYRDTKLDLYPPGHGPAEQDSSIWVIRATCRHKAVITSLANYMIERYNHIIEVTKRLRQCVERREVSNKTETEDKTDTENQTQ